LLDDAKPVEVNQPIEISFTAPPGARRLTIDVWDRFGKPVRQLVDETDLASGHRSVTWDFTTDAGSPLPDGSYIYRVSIDGQAESRIVQLKRNS
jgi:flagellar hook assembly protein FlgD